MSSPSISVASWSDLNAVYQENSAAALEVVNNVLNSPHNTWNYPSPGSPRASSPVVPWSPTVASSPELPFEFVVPGFPFLNPIGPDPYDIVIPQSPQYSTLSTSAGITLVNPDTLEPTPVDPNPYIVRSPSPPTPAPTFEALLAAAKFDLKQLKEETAVHVIRLAQEELNAYHPHPSLQPPLPRLLPPPRRHPLSDLPLYFTPPSTSAYSSISLPPRLASLPTATLISTPSITSKAATSGSHQRNSSTASS